ncbi:MAG: zinc ABC transporter substrate-binding protein [Clostridia bacterium]|nr:zinc ABC transporter substrate-binding protein [Clostridia bacterium]
MKKKIFPILSLLLTAVLLFAACGGNAPQKDPDGKLKILCTIFPEYDWVRQILGERTNEVDLDFLLDSGTDLHSFQMTTDDKIAILNSDLFIYTGGESDKWVDDVLRDAPDLKTLNLLEALGDNAKAEEALEGMQENEEEEEEEEEMDEHIWLSLKNAAILSEAIEGKIAELDPENASVYEENLKSFTASLDALDKEYQASVDGAQFKSVMFCDRFPFRYMTEDYGITPYAAFSGCSTESQASVETQTFLIEKLNELGLPAVIVTESCDQSTAKTVVNSSNDKDRKIVVMDSMQSVTAQKAAEGCSYLDVMTENLRQLRIALGYSDAE